MNKKNLLIVIFINVCIILAIFVFTEVFIVSPKAAVWKWAKYENTDQLSDISFADKALTKLSAHQISDLLYNDWQKINNPRYKEYWDKKSIKLSNTTNFERENISSTSGTEMRWCVNDNDIEFVGISESAFTHNDSINSDSINIVKTLFFEEITDHEMKFRYKVFGDQEFGDRSLFISLHGGGNVDSDVNDSQWNNQIDLYSPKEGIYVAPRAPENDWNMWFKSYMPYFYQELIRSAICVMGVNPDKIYITGYSAGGDGLYRIAPIFADRFASAAMMAGHPGETSPLSLINLPYAIWMGENDEAYSRNAHARSWGIALDSLQAETSPEHYIHSINIIKGKGHWMDKADTAAIDWMSKYIRNPYPKKVVWKNDNELSPRDFYWISIDDKSQRKNSYLVVNNDNNVIDIEECNVSHFTINLNDEIVDLDKSVIVNYKGKEIYNSKPKRTIRNIYESIYKRGDKRYIFSAKIDIAIP